MAAVTMTTTSSGLTKLLSLGLGTNSNNNITVNPKSRRMSMTSNYPQNPVIIMFGNAKFASLKSVGGGAGVLEKPAFDQSQFDPSTQVLRGGDIGRLKDKKRTGSGDSYRVLLIDDIRHSLNLVAKVLPQVVPSVTPDDARRLFHESRENGMAVVIVTVKEHAEFYAQMMLRGGLRSTIEPDSSIL